MTKLFSSVRFPFWGACSVALAAVSSAPAAQPVVAADRQPTPQELREMPAVASPEKAATLLKEVQFPEEFEVSIFATPPAVNYPVFVAAAPDGTLYVSSDGNGSLDRKPHLGRVLRVRDINGDGQADEVRALVPDVDSPRGLVWDQDRLYLLHPPDISVFIDQDGDGLAEEKKTLVSGLGWTFKDRPADHGSNGLELGIDGWLYAAIGDFGFMEATGTDGRKLQLRGGGVVRVRPDGTGLELFAEGTRNIVEAAVGPLLDVFARDNTNDGGGWDIRLHHFSGLTQHGYPRLFKNFPDEIIQPLADYGGGSGCGAAWIDEPGIPVKWNNAPFAADWGTEWIYRHGLIEKGATFSATQEPFAKLPRVTDLDVDANSAIYAGSWKGASFTWVGTEVGFIARATPKGFKPEPLPDFNTASDAELAKLLESPSHRRRLAAQRTLVKRWTGNLAEDVSPGWALRTGAAHPVRSVVQLARNPQAPVASRIAALFLLAQTVGVGGGEMAAELVGDATVGPWAIRAFTDRQADLGPALTASILGSLKSSNPRMRKEAIMGLVRQGRVDHGDAILPRVADPDPIVAHTAVQGLIRLGAGDDCLIALAERETAPEVRDGVLRVLQSIHRPEVVLALMGTLSSETDPARRAGLVTALCRLHFKEGDWKGDSWGTRPDTRGPFYQPEPWRETATIAATLKAALAKADSREAAWIGRELSRHRIPAGDAMDLLMARAATDESLLPAVAAQLAEAETIPAGAVPLLVRVAIADSTADAVRAQAVIALAHTADPAAWQAVLKAMPRVQGTKTENNLAEKARSAVANAPGLDQVHGVFEEQALRLDGEASLMAEGMLLKLASRKTGAPEAREAASRSLDAGWAVPARRRQILRAAAQVRDTSRAAQFVAALNDLDPEVAKTAADTVKRLKIDPAQFRADAASPHLGDLGVAAVLDAVMSTSGEVTMGEQSFTQLGCTGCHTVKADEPLKGPYLGTIAKTYRRRELAEAILIPNKTLAQGFITHHFELKDGSEVDGFVVQEAADAVTIRTVTAQEQKIPVNQIARREKQERSLMPEGLAAGLTVRQFASLLDYLQALSAAQ